MVAEAKKLARRSVIIDHCGFDYIDLKSGINNVEQAYSVVKETRRGTTKLSILEFASEEDADALVKDARHNEGLLPIKLKFLLYTGSSGPNSAQQNLDFPVSRVQLSSTDDFNVNFNSFTSLTSRNMMSLVDLKLRFITLVNLERFLCTGIFDEYELMPFGSSVIDTGTNTGDLDLVITRKEDHHKALLDTFTYRMRLDRTVIKQSKFLHIDKSLYRDSGVRSTMRWFESLLRDYMPLTDNHSIQSIHSAKVPIIRFTSRHTSIDCDLSFDLGLDSRDNITGPRTSIPMTEALYSFCRHSSLFVSLVFYLRIFAKLTNITSKEPNVGMTNFQLLSLIIGYLQQTALERTDDKKLTAKSRSSLNQETILPSFKQLVNSGFRPPWEAIELSEDQINEIMPDLLLGFFKFYSNFDFDNHALNIHDAKIEKKLDNSMIYVLNPIDTARNVCHNVNRKACDNFIMQMQTALKVMNVDGGKNSSLELLKHLMKKHQQTQRKSKIVNMDPIHNNNNQHHIHINAKGRVRRSQIAQDVFK